MKPLLVVIGGPTASGKSDLALRLARHFKTVIVSADSRQFYCEISIGTAKPSADELNQVRHYFINSHSITQHLNAGTYAFEARKKLAELFKSLPLVIVAGGSGLYIDAMLYGMDNLPEASPEIRKHLDEIFRSEGIHGLGYKLRELDPEAYEGIDKNNPRRVMRALEINLVSGKPLAFHSGEKKPLDGTDVLFFATSMPREKLYRRINERVKNMLALGLEQEVRSVLAYRDMPALKTVGYKEMFQYIDGEKTLDETEQMIAQNTRNYAKRQLTWFRRYSDLIWVDPGDDEVIIEMIGKKTG